MRYPICLLRALSFLCVSLPAFAAPADESGQLDRSPRQVAEQLADVYGHKLDQVAYIPALPLVAKLRLSELTGEPMHARKSPRSSRRFCG